MSRRADLLAPGDHRLCAGRPAPESPPATAGSAHRPPLPPAPV